MLQKWFLKVSLREWLKRYPTLFCLDLAEDTTALEFFYESGVTPKEN
jgi:hypothetical protein